MYNLIFSKNCFMSTRMLRGRSLTPASGRGAAKRARSVSIRSRSSSGSSLMRVGNKGRAWPYPQDMSKFFDPFPSKMRAVLRYSETVLLNPSVGGTAHALFRTNSIFDPNYSGAGHQPYGHDTYESIYNHYQVLKSVCSVTWSSSAQPAHCGLTMTDDAVVSGTYDTVREIKPTKFGIYQTGIEPLKLTQKFVSTDVFGFDAGGKTTAKMGADPADQCFFDIWAQATDSGSDIGQLSAVVNIVYYCEFTELKDLGQS